MRDMIIFKTKKRLLLKACTVLALAALVFILPPATCLAETVDVTRQVSLTVKPAGGGEQDKNEFSDDIGNAHIVIDLYKVADAKKVSGYDTYDFSVKELYKGLFEKDDADIKKMTNEQWRKAGQEAAAIALGTAPEAQAQTPDVKGAGIDTKMSDLGAGLYLVIARGSTISSNEYIKTSEDGRIYTIANSDLYEYRFEPELVALPSKDVNEAGQINTANTGEWIYDAVIYLKAAREPVKSSIRIVKKLDKYETKDPATFVFHVFDTDTKGKVYDDYFPIVFDEPSEKAGKEILIEDLPAGLKLTVEETYSGGNYAVTTDKSRQVTVEAAQVVRAEFKNTYDDTYKGGGSIANKFSNDTKNGWEWVQGLDDDGNDHARK